MSASPSACPVPPYPGLIKGSPGHNFALAMTILFPIFVLVCTLSFYSMRNTTVFLRKRSFSLTLLSALGTIIPWSCTSLYDYLGSENYPCGIYIFLVYASNCAISYPLVLKIAMYQNQVSLFRLGRELQEGRGSITDGLLLKDPLRGELSLRTFAAHIRVAFMFRRGKEDRILNAKFSRTFGLKILWFMMVFFPFFVGYFVRLGMNPQWNTCTGCEIETADAAFLIAISSFALLLSALANKNFITRVSRRDALRIVRECMWSWMAGGFFYNLSFILFIIDPGNLYAMGIFNWRFVKLVATGVLYYIQTIHQVLISKWLQRKLVLAPALDQSERFAEVMSSKELRSKLMGFLDGELSGEILKFLNAVDEYKRIHGMEGSQALGRQIFSTFIVRGSPLEINISASARSQLLHLLPPGNFSADIFDEAYIEIKHNFLADGFSRFIKKLEKEHARTQQTRAVTAASPEV